MLPAPRLSQSNHYNWCHHQYRYFLCIVGRYRIILFQWPSMPTCTRKKSLTRPLKVQSTLRLSLPTSAVSCSCCWALRAFMVLWRVERARRETHAFWDSTQSVSSCSSSSFSLLPSSFSLVLGLFSVQPVTVVRLTVWTWSFTTRASKWTTDFAKLPVHVTSTAVT